MNKPHNFVRSRRPHRRQHRARWGAKKGPFASEIRWAEFWNFIGFHKFKNYWNCIMVVTDKFKSQIIHIHTQFKVHFIFSVLRNHWIYSLRKKINFKTSTCSKRIAAQSSNELLALVCSPLLLSVVCFVDWLRVFSNVIQMMILKSNRNSRKIEKLKSWKKKLNIQSRTKCLFTRKLRRKKRARRKYSFALRYTHSNRIIDAKFLYKIFYLNFK